MQARLAALGHQQLALPEGTVRGHTFHYSSAQTPLAPCCHSTVQSDAPVVSRTSRPDEPVAAGAGEALYRLGSVYASYFHAWFPSNSLAVARLLGGVAA